MLAICAGAISVSIAAVPAANKLMRLIVCSTAGNTNQQKLSAVLTVTKPVSSCRCTVLGKNMGIPFKGRDAGGEGSSFCLLAAVPMSLAKAGSHPAPLLPAHTSPALASSRMHTSQASVRVRLQLGTVSHICNYKHTMHQQCAYTCIARSYNY